MLTHWGRVTHICVGNPTIIGPDNGLSPGRRQAIIWTNAEILLIGTLGTNFSEILIEILIFSFKKMCLKVSSAKRRPFRLRKGGHFDKDFRNKIHAHGWFTGTGTDSRKIGPSRLTATKHTTETQHSANEPRAHLFACTNLVVCLIPACVWLSFISMGSWYPRRVSWSHDLCVVLDMRLQCLTGSWSTWGHILPTYTHRNGHFVCNLLSLRSGFNTDVISSVNTTIAIYLFIHLLHWRQPTYICDN